MAHSPDEVSFVQGVSGQTGIDPRVLFAWDLAEGAYAPGGTGGHNYLNLRPYPGDPYSSVSSGNFEQFSSVDNAITATVRRIKQPFAGPIISAAEAHASPAQEISAIASTGWDAGHYGGSGGPRLLAAFNTLYPGQAGTPGEDVKQQPGPSVTDVGSNIKAGGGVIAAAATGPIHSVEDAIKFVFSYRFLEIVGGLGLIAVGVVGLVKNEAVKTVVQAVVPAAPASSYSRPATEGNAAGRRERVTLPADEKPARRSSSGDDFGDVPF